MCCPSCFDSFVRWCCSSKEAVVPVAVADLERGESPRSVKKADQAAVEALGTPETVGNTGVGAVYHRPAPSLRSDSKLRRSSAPKVEEEEVKGGSAQVSTLVTARDLRRIRRAARDARSQGSVPSSSVVSVSTTGGSKASASRREGSGLAQMMPARNEQSVGEAEASSLKGGAALEEVKGPESGASAGGPLRLMAPRRKPSTGEAEASSLKGGAAPEEVKGPESEASAGGALRKKVTILWSEDEATFRRMAGRVFTRMRSGPRLDLTCRVLIVPDGEEMENALRGRSFRHHPMHAPDTLEEHRVEEHGAITFDLVISDISMPGKTGNQVVADYRREVEGHDFSKKATGLKIIAYTGESFKDAEEVKAFCLKNGFNALMPKPTPLRTIREVIGKEVEQIYARRRSADSV